jgi:hypothetical protein
MSDTDYEALEKWYIALDLDKDIFARIVAAAGVKTLVDRAGYAGKLLTAWDEYAWREKYKQDKLRLEAMEREASDLRAAIKAYEKRQIY